MKVKTMSKETGLARRGLWILLVLALTGTQTYALTSDEGGDSLPASVKSAGPGCNEKLIPAEKQLSAAWVQSLTARGEKEVFQGNELETIGMPCGGIGAGQLYLTGDGTLGSWMIFNNAFSYMKNRSTYGIPFERGLVDQGFALELRGANGAVITRKLNRASFSRVRFRGEYPIATVEYSEKGLPVRVEMEVFSPFIPLNAADSSLPATIFSLTVENTSTQKVQASLLGWLENGVCPQFRQNHAVIGRTRVLRDNASQLAVHSAELPAAPASNAILPMIVFEDFEGSDFARWTVEGTAFGGGPVGVTLAEQRPVSGFLGRGFANSIHGGRKSEGALLSAPFTITHKYINFLLGGAGLDKRACITLEVDGQTVRSAPRPFADQGTMTWHGWYVESYIGKEARIHIVDRTDSDPRYLTVDHIEFSDTPRQAPSDIAKAPDFGSMALLCLEPGASTLEEASSSTIPKAIQQGEELYPLQDARRVLLRSDWQQLEPGEKRTCHFVLAWHFPNRREWGQFYASRFEDAREVCLYVQEHFNRLTGDTRLWRDLYYGGTLPFWLLDRLHSTVSILSTGTCEWRRNGRFWAFEGVAAGFGTCTHVWAYAQAHARLFPELARNIRERQDFMPITDGGGFYPESGLVAFRDDKTFGFAADGQCATVLNAYREHQMSADSQFLQRNWLYIKKALGYLIEQDAKGEDGGGASPQPGVPLSPVKPEAKTSALPNGVLEGAQHNTYDVNFHGPNPMVGTLYLAALRAGEEMAREMGDETFARKTRSLFEMGQRWTLDHLWNGEYFIQDVDKEKHPHWQHWNGCLSDQLFGQSWAHQVGLGHLYPRENVLSALRSVWKYNWTPDVGPFNAQYDPGRWFVKPGLPGLFICTWPKGGYNPHNMPYKNEVWTGIEYEVAANMINEGLLTEGLAICRAIHDRYRPGVSNPYNEVEYGDHYARAMASWGVYLALAGFEYHGPKGYLGFAPRITPDHFRAAFTTAQGWVTFEQTRSPRKQVARIGVAKGRLNLKTMTFEPPKTFRSPRVTVHVGPQGTHCQSSFEQGRLTIALPKEINLTEGEEIEITIKDARLW